MHRQHDPGHHPQRSHARAGRSLAGRGPAGTKHCHRCGLRWGGVRSGTSCSRRAGGLSGHSGMGHSCARPTSAISAAPTKKLPTRRPSLWGCAAVWTGVWILPAFTHWVPQSCLKRGPLLCRGGGEANFWTLLFFIPRPVLLDIFSGVHAPLSKAFLWCQWEIIAPIDIEIDQDLDVSRPAVRRAIREVLPSAGAMSCATKSRAREKRPGPPPLRSEECPRSLVTTCWRCSTGAQNLACLRENPLRSLHWWGPIAQFVYQEGDWFDLCVFGGARRKAQKFRHNIPELASLNCQVWTHSRP